MEAMQEYLRLQDEAKYFYSEYCKERRKSGKTDLCENWQCKYHFTRVKMNELRKWNKLMFE